MSPKKRARTDSEEFQGQNLPRQWIGTWNNYTESDIENFRKWCLNHTTFSICGKEVAPSTGTPHLQSFHQMNATIRFKTFKSELPHISVTPVTKDNGAVSYCEKEDNLAFKTGQYVEKRPGKRTDLQKVAEMATSGATMTEIATENPVAVMQFGQGIQRLISLYEKPRDRNIPKIVKVYYGSTGTGKTRLAFDQIPDAYVWEPSMNHWFDGYSGHKTVIFDEFRGQLPLGMVLRLFDRYPMRVQYKGGSTQFVADTIIVTSPMHWTLWYKDLATDKIDQLKRRFGDHVYNFDDPEQRTAALMPPPPPGIYV